MSGGGVITATTQNGTNRFHGSAYEYLRNTILNANGWYRNFVGLPRAAYHGRIYGFSLGGPVLFPKVYNGRNKTFFFANYEITPSTVPDAITASVPTAAMRNGDFSGLVDQNGKQIKIYDPTTTTLVSGTTNKWTRSGIASQLLGNWQLSGITTYGSGLPIVITAPSNTFLSGISANADRLHDPHLKSGQDPLHWFDTTAYGIPASFTVGTGNRIEPDLRGPLYGNWDLGLIRRQNFEKDVTLELRIEGVNIFNNRNLNSPNGGVTGGTFGQITGSGQARNLQAGARLSF